MRESQAMMASARTSAEPAADRPLADWDDDEWWDERVLWWSRFDDRYLVETRHTGNGEALILVFDHPRGDLLVFQQVVPLVGDARYGPDPDDVERWQKLIVGWADAMTAGGG